MAATGRRSAPNPSRRATSAPSAPRFAAENLDRNLALVETLRELGEAKNATVAQLAIAWSLSRGDDVALVGARSRERLAEALGALDLELTAGDLGEIEEAIPAGAAAGERYQQEQLATLDSERSATEGTAGST